ncbi:hypothetical protein FGG08_001328 [Glutinoglossum americanum]|uniref:Uncharacterized protein n=1 Tax=Glutinoglossum americanum TaxID=1670608 RepID=A0A9P8L2W4_9PEZI|nr:hypothetical protein FGG08_001328 [Glutinoglossum americanum]
MWGTLLGHSLAHGQTASRKTTLTKHARRTHCIRNDNDLTDDDGSDSESDPQVMEQPSQRSGWVRTRHSMPRGFISAGAQMSRAQSLQNLKSDMVAPHSPQTSRSLSSRASFSADAFGYVTAPIMQAQNSAQSFASNNPPTPQSPIYLTEHSHDDGISTMGNAPRTLGGDFRPSQRGPVSQADMDALKIVCSTPAKHQQLVAPNLQNSPSSLSSCSSATSNSCHSQEYYYRNTQQAPVANYQLQSNQLDPNAMVQYHQIPVSMSAGSTNQMQAITPTADQAMWYDTLAYQQPVMVAPPQPVGQPRLYPTYGNGYPVQPEWMVKTDQDTSMMLPSPRSALY